MDALGFSASRSNATCSSVEDLQAQLHHLLAAKTTDTRAEHVSPSFELLSHTTFHLAADSENGAADGAGPEHTQPQQPPTARVVLVSETVQNQPTDDPVLQKAVAKHISNAIGAVDNSAWIIRQVTRGAQGWRFSYICKDSLQSWNRANAKNPKRPPIGSYSGSGGLDPINLSRPAFDCRGALTIAFSKSSRGIVVKYEHTPLHQTVTQLVERLIPAPIPIPNNNNASHRTPKAKRPRPTDGDEGSQKKKTPKTKPLAVDGDDTGRKKRTPKAKQPPQAEGENSEGRRKKRRKTGIVTEATTGETGDGQDTPQSQTPLNSAADKTGVTGFLNVPPAEAERRRQTAIELLTGKGIDPATLSAEQFNIFANQAPNLQSASLDMLAKYGAERLRIVHPDEKEQAGSSNSTPATGQTAINSPAAAPALPLGETPTKKPRNKKRKSTGPLAEVSIGNGAVVSLEQDGELGTTESALKPTTARARKTRGRCDTCKQRNVKCTKEHPSCSICIDAGVNCIYLPPKPRRKSEKSAEIVEEDDTDLPKGNDGVQEEAEIIVHTSVLDPPGPPAIASPHPPPDIENEEFIPDPNILSGPVEHQTAATQHPNPGNYYQQSHSGISFPQPSSPPAADTPSMPNFTYPQEQTNGNGTQATTGVGFPPTPVQPHQAHGLPASQFASSSTPHQRVQSASSSRRKSLPTSQPKQTPIPPPTIPTHVSNWSPSPSIHHPTSASPKTAHQQVVKQPKPRRPRAETGHQAHDSLKQAPPQSTQYQSPMTRSPYQSAAHINPKQGPRSQTNTPTATTSRPPPQAPSTVTHQPTTSSSSHNVPSTSSSLPSYDSYSRYNSNNNGSEQYLDAGNDHSSSRGTYESNSYQTNATTTAPSAYSSVHSYDYGRASGTLNPLSQALNGAAAYTGTTSSTTNQWPTSQTRSAQNTNSSSTYSLPTGSTSSSHGYDTRASDSRASNQNASYNQSQSQNYSTYPSQQSSLNQQSQQNWYGFTAANSSNQASYANNRRSGHGSHRANAPPYSNQYGGNDEQAIYDLLRAGSSNH